MTTHSSQSGSLRDPDPNDFTVDKPMPLPLEFVHLMYRDYVLQHGGIQTEGLAIHPDQWLMDDGAQINPQHMSGLSAESAYRRKRWLRRKQKRNVQD